MDNSIVHVIPEVSDREPIKQLRVQVRVYNNLIRQRREKLGLSQVEAAKKAHVSHLTWNGFECLKRKPFTRGIWSDSALRISIFLRVSVEDLWPEEVLVVEKNKVERNLDVNDALLLLGQKSQNLLENSEDNVVRQFLARDTHKLLGTLTPREEKVIRMHFGIGEKDGDHTLEEIANNLEVTIERVRQLERKALYKLRSPSRSKFIKSYHMSTSMEDERFHAIMRKNTNRKRNELPWEQIALDAMEESIETSQWFFSDGIVSMWNGSKHLSPPNNPIREACHNIEEFKAILKKVGENYWKKSIPGELYMYPFDAEKELKKVMTEKVLDKLKKMKWIT